jgi:hypothetical protein
MTNRMTRVGLTVVDDWLHSALCVFARRLQRIAGHDLPLQERFTCFISTDAHHRGRPKNKT